MTNQDVINPDLPPSGTGCVECLASGELAVGELGAAVGQSQPQVSKHLRVLESAGARHITPLVFLEPAEHLLAMGAVPQPHENWKALLLAGRLEPDHVRQFANLAALTAELDGKPLPCRVQG